MHRSAPTTVPGIGPAMQLDWGTHICQLYRTREDLVEILVPFFADGLTVGDQCLWITCEPLPAHAAVEALRHAVPELDERIARGDIEIIDHADWYVRNGAMDTEAVVAAWLAREQRALDRGYRGLRLSGNTFWVERADWQSFAAYEAAVHAAFADRRILALCSYSLEERRTNEIVDVLRNHSCALTRRGRRWDAAHDATTALDWLNEAARRERREAPPSSRTNSQTAHEHLVRLQRVTAALSPAVTVADVARVVVTEMANALDAQMATLAVPINEGADLMVIGHTGLRDETVEQFSIFPVATALPLAKVYRQGTPEWLQDPEAITAAYPGLDEETRRSQALACAPLVVGGRRLGAVGFGYTRPQMLTPDRRALLDDLAKQVAFAVERARLYEDTRRARDRLQMLSEATHRLATGTLHLGEVLEALVHEVTRQLAEACTIVLRDEHSTALWVAAVRHVDPEIERELRDLVASTPLEVGQGIIGRVAETGTSILVPRVERDVMDALAPEHREHYQRHRIRSVMAVPLRVSGENIGVLGAARYARREAFVEDDRALLQDLADCAALAIRNARQYARERDASRRKDEFLAVLGHELRNPLSPIVTALEVMKLRGTGGVREREVIERQVLHVNRLVDDLLDVSRVTRGLVELRRERISLESALNHALETASPILEERGHRVHVTPCRDALFIDVDPTRFKQVLVNLLSNAARYSNVGSRIDVICKQQEERVSIIVKDHGIGIAADALPTIFDPFVQVQRNVEAARGGLGLGLALVKSLIELHGGSVTVQSDGVGEGSAFTITLPTANAHPTSDRQRPDATDPVAGERRRIMVVDDNSDAADSLGDFLRALGHDVLVAYDAPQALTRANESPVDIAVLDIGLPVMDGYELARRLREQSSRPIRMIAVTGYGTDKDRQRSTAAGFDAHLVKPVAIDALLAHIARTP
jgi:signal transduction histidine kinase